MLVYLEEWFTQPCRDILKTGNVIPDDNSKTCQVTTTENTVSQ